MRKSTRGGRGWLRARVGILLALTAISAIVVSSAAAMRYGTGHARHLAASGGITAKQHEGQSSDGTYTSGNITQYKEGDTINFRFTLSSDAAGSGQLQVRFTGNDGTCLFFDNYFALGSIDNVSGTSPTVGVASGPTADSFGTSNGEWVVTLNVDFADAGSAVVNYQLKLSSTAGDCSGSSQHSRLSPGDGVDETGQQNVPVPANQVIELPSITVTKMVDRGTGTFVTADAGEYCFSLDGGTCTAIDSSGRVTFTALSNGSHTITESSNLAHPGYTFDSGTGTNCTFSGSTATATVASGTTATNAACTFKNKLTAQPKVTVTKSCPNGAASSGDRFQAQLDGSSAGTALACGGSLDVNPTPGQAYSITEAAAGTTDFANYNSSLSSGCSGTLTYGGTATCTITNTLKAAPKVAVTKSCPNGPAASGDRFQVQLNGSNAGTALACSGSLDVTVTAGQAYSVTEAAAGTTDLTNYDSTLSTDCSGTLAHYGDTASCTITNTLKAAPKVTVTKSCPNGAANSGDRFQVKRDGTNVGSALACGDSVDVTVTAGQAYAITEGAAGTTDLANYATTLSTDCSGTLAHYGDTAACTIANTLKAAPKVTVTKACPGGPAGSGDRFQVKRDGTNVGSALACGGNLDVPVTAAQAYAITEGAAGTTDLGNYDTTLSTDCSGTLAHYGDTAACTITNTLRAGPKVTIAKACPGGKAAAGDRFQVKRGGSSVGDPLDCGDSLDVTVTAGQAYAITEGAAGTTDPANYDTTLGSGCSGTLAHFGDTASCTITNTLREAPKVTIEKACPNGKAASTDRFQARLDGNDVGDPLDCGDSVDVNVGVGKAYSITEAAAATTDLANYTSALGDGCSGTLAHYGDTATCTLTNTLKAAPKVSVTKACPGGKAAAGDRFQVKRNGTNVDDPLDCGDTTNATVTAGEAYAITEGAAGTTDLANYTATSSEGCSGTLAHYGDTADCTLTNTLKAAPKVTVVKHVINNDGGAKGAGDFTLAAGGSGASPASFPGSEIGTVVTLQQPGPYAINEGAVSGYATSKSSGCSGTLAHYGDTATCTVTNDDVAPPPPPTGPPLTDLKITKTDSPDPVSVGALLTYTLTVTNKKGDTAHNVVVTDSLPSEVTLVSVASTKGTCSGSIAITCNFDSVAYNELVTITIVVRPTATGTITNTAVVAGREAEQDPSDNTASATTLVQGAFTPPSVCYSMRVTPRSLTVGRHSVIRVSVREAGKPVAGVQVVVSGRGVSKRARTSKAGLATISFTPSRPGILQIRVPTHATCSRQRIGVVGVFTPPVTG